MSESLSEILRGLISRDGGELTDDRSRLEAELRAQAPEEGRAIHLLLVARDAGVPDRLRRLEGRADASDIEASAVDLVERFGVAERFARSAVETWAAALRPPAEGAPVARRPDAEGGPPTGPPSTNHDAGSPLSEKPEPQRRHAEEAPERLSRSTQDGGASFETPAAQAPQDDEVRGGRTSPEDDAVELFRLDLELLGERPAPPSEETGRSPIPMVSPSPAASFAPSPPPSEATGVAQAKPQRSALRPALLGLAAALLAACGVGAFLWMRSETRPTRAPEAANAPTTQPVPATAQTPEGYPVLGMTERPVVSAKAIEGRPDTLLVTFGVRQGAEALTYQAAADFSRGDEAGVGLLRVFRSGQEAATEPRRIARRPESDGYRGFTLSGALAGPVFAPNLCITVLTRETKGAGLLCAFAARSDGTCAAETPLGCATLQP